MLSLGCRVAGYIGDVTTQIKLLERAVAIDPADKVLANMLRLAQESASPVPEPVSQPASS